MDFGAFEPPIGLEPTTPSLRMMSTPLFSTIRLFVDVIYMCCKTVN